MIRRREVNPRPANPLVILTKVRIQGRRGAALPGSGS
jgi:hypothetical protein